MRWLETAEPVVRPSCDRAIESTSAKCPVGVVLVVVVSQKKQLLVVVVGHAIVVARRSRQLVLRSNERTSRSPLAMFEPIGDATRSTNGSIRKDDVVLSMIAPQKRRVWSTREDHGRPGHNHTRRKVRRMTWKGRSTTQCHDGPWSCGCIERGMLESRKRLGVVLWTKLVISGRCWFVPIETVLLENHEPRELPTKT